MSQEDLQYNLLRATDALKQIKWHRHLLDIAVEHTATFNEKNFDRIAVLLDCYISILDCHTEELEYAFQEVKSSVTLSNTLTS